MSESHGVPDWAIRYGVQVQGGKAYRTAELRAIWRKVFAPLVRRYWRLHWTLAKHHR